jgi:hypothetical protein
LTDSTIAICSFHHQLLAAISFDLLLSHVEGVDCLLPIRAIRGVEWGDDVNMAIAVVAGRPWPIRTRSDPPHLAWNDDRDSKRRKDVFDDDTEGGGRNIIGSFFRGGFMVVFSGAQAPYG